MIKTLTATQARQNLGEVLEEVYYHGNQFIIERAGKPIAAVVPLWQAQARNEHRKRVSAMLDRLWKSRATSKSPTVHREVAEAIRFVRSKPTRKKG